MTHSKYRDEREIAGLVRAFETATITRDAWKHPEHLVVALYYAHEYGLNEGTDRMRSGILNLLVKGFGIDLETEMPYHETITVFWMRTVYGFLMMRTGCGLGEIAAELASTFDKDFPLRFYSREELFSDRARREYIGPDRVEFDPVRFLAGDSAR